MRGLESQFVQLDDYGNVSAFNFEKDSRGIYMPARIDGRNVLTLHAVERDAHDKFCFMAEKVSDSGIVSAHWGSGKYFYTAPNGCSEERLILTPTNIKSDFVIHELKMHIKKMEESGAYLPRLEITELPRFA